MTSAVAQGYVSPLVVSQGFGLAGVERGCVHVEDTVVTTVTVTDEALTTVTLADESC